MCFTILPARPVQQLVAAAQNILSLMDEGILGAAFSDGNPDSVNTAIAAFDRLTECATALAGEQKIVTPFLRYRQEILCNGEMAKRLRGLILNLWGGRQANLSLLFHNADEHHTRIALECIVSYTQHGENDSYFMTLASEIIELDGNGYTVTVQVPDDLTGFTDVYLVSLWHLSQINPAPFGDPEACIFAEKVGREIIRRFLDQVGPELWNHQGAHVGAEKRIKEGATA